MGDHDRTLAEAFDGQAARFERAPAQTDPAALARLVAFAALPPGAEVLDGGCGPGLVAETFLEAGCHVHGVDLSTEMLRLAQARCARFGARARFEQGSVLSLGGAPRFDAAVSRFVLHHLEDPVAFLRAQAALVRPGGALVASDHVTDPEPAACDRHQRIEIGRDRSHARNLTSGGLADAFAAAGLAGLRLFEEPFELDFDEWFDRGTPSLPKDAVRALALESRARGFTVEQRADGGLTLHCIRVLVRGVKPR